ncbi:MAG: ATP-binding protein [Dehalococcoidia bacterium]
MRTPLEFVDTVLRDVEAHLRGTKRTATRVRSLLTQLAGAEVKGIKLPEAMAPHWKALLVNTLEDLVQHQDRTVVLFWDETPLMLHNVRKSSGEAAAMEVLDALRSLRQMHPRLRMVFAGSIGLHNVVTSLRRAGYANDPTNDMDTVDVPPLSTDHARELARGLLRGERIQVGDLAATAAAIAAAVDGVPYFIHHVIDQIAQRGGAADVTAVSEIVNQSLTDPQDRWHLRYYRERIDTYYNPDERPFALALLDVLSTTDQPLPFEPLFNLLKSRIVTEDSETARSVLALLQRDHYLAQQPDGKYRFRFPLIQRSWRLQRGLAP